MEITKINFGQSQSIIIVGQVASEVLQKNFAVSDQDYFEISGCPENYTIAKIKELLHFIYLKPYNSARKLAVIQQAENLNTQSANVLLKTLEEPPAYAVIILTTLNEQKILPTILSRCSKIKLNVTADLATPEIYLNPGILGQKSVAERFQWAAKAAETEDVDKIILLWLNFYREKMLAGQNVLAILNRLTQARDLLQTNISVKLLLENLLLNFDHEN